MTAQQQEALDGLMARKRAQFETSRHRRRLS